MIDVGAHKGEFLSSFLQIKKIKKFYCFEPQIKIFKKLSGLYKKNKKILLFNNALGEKFIKKKIIFIKFFINFDNVFLQSKVKIFKI